jgi:hypothetical protein
LNGRISQWNYLSFQFTPLSPSLFWSTYFPSAYTLHSPHGDYLACVFMILSLGSLFDPALPATPNMEAHRYFTLSFTTLSAARFLSNSTLAVIQTLQLAANFLLNQHECVGLSSPFFLLSSTSADYFFRSLAD